MKRDWDVIRRILVEIEALPSGVRLRSDDYESIDAEVVGFNMALLIEAELVKGTCLDTGGPIVCHVWKLTWQGCELLDGIRKDTAWERVKDYIKNKGLDLTLNTVMQAAKSVAAQVLF